MASTLQRDAYDIIICGGGTAGCVLANRLTEDPNLQVLLLEAGENANQDPRISTPGLFLMAINSERDWQYETEPAPAMNGRVFPLPAGKCLGGGSTINLMALIYPNAASIDSWTTFGNPTWSWHDLSPYYRKVVRRYPPSEEVKQAFHLPVFDEKDRNPDGKIASAYPTGVHPVPKAWADTWTARGEEYHGYPLEDSPSVGGYTSNSSFDPETYERSHSGVAYYAPASHRENLHTVTGALIDKVELDASSSESVVATGVTFTHAGRSFTAQARKEVILSSGVFGSPAILERSGIGSKALHSQLGIPNVIDNPYVGENLQDHLMAALCYEAADGISTADEMRDPAIVQKVIEEYNTNRTWPTASAPGAAFANVSLLDSVDSLPKDELRALMYRYIPEDAEPKFPAQKALFAFIRSILESPTEASSSYCMGPFQLSLDLKTVRECFMPSHDGNYVTILPMLAHPLSRGHVHISSRDNEQRPAIQLNYGDNELDIEILARHLMIVETIATTSPFAEVLKKGGRRLPIGKDALTLERAKELIRATACSNYHASGTCAMMSEELGGVVDERLRVHGVTGLRVVDASIFPTIPRGNIQTTVYAVAEKASDIIKADLKAAA